MRSSWFELRVIGLGLLTLLAVIAATVNVRQESEYRLPDDGVFWVDTGQQVVAGAITARSPAAAADLRVGDRLVGIDSLPIQSATGVTPRLFTLGVGAHTRYQVLRQGTLTELDVVLDAQPRPTTVRGYLRVVGALYLLLGVYVLLRRFRAARATHFYLFCLASFVLFAFSYTGKLDSFDWAIYWTSVVAFLLTPALFAHFCCVFPGAQVEGRRKLALLALYGTAAALGVVHVGVARQLLRLDAPLLQVRWWLDRLETGYLVAAFSLGIGFLLVAYRKASQRLLRKQLGWALAGSLLGVSPFATFYALPYFAGALPGPWMNLSSLSLVLLPLAFSYAIVRHRLLDVEIFLQRGMAYTLAMATLVSVYLGLAALAGDFFRTHFPAAGTLGLVLAVIATGLLFQPLQSWIQTKLEQHFLRSRYDYRQALSRFGRELSTDTDLDRMIGSLLERLVRTLHLRRAAVFLADDAATERFALREAVGIDIAGRSENEMDWGFLRLLETAEGFPAGNRRDRLFFDDLQQDIARQLGPSAAENPDWQRTVARLELHSYFACRSKNRLVAVLGLGATDEGELLSEDDAALVETLAGYLAVAVENASLIGSLAAKARQYERLQEFSENILESIHVGLIAVDLEDRIEAVNSSLGQMYPLFFPECRGRKLAEVFPPDLVRQLERFRDDAGVQAIYRYRVRNLPGEDRVLNIACTPLLSKNCECIGRLILFEDVTEQVTLETQLAQAEKMSAVGLLAAGVAHEGNTPLTVISTQAQMLGQQLPSGDRTTRIVEKIISQTFRASEIVNSLLNFSRTKGTTLAPVELNPIISETLLLLEHQFRTASIAVERLLEPGLPPISGSGDKLQQVFLNLFLNAKDAMTEGGRLRVSTWAEDSVVHVEVSDTGVGIPPENLQRIYDPFFTTKTSCRGTGLGLSVSYGIIQEHSGKIQAESWPGMGTRFRLEFPVLRQPVHA